MLIAAVIIVIAPAGATALAITALQPSLNGPLQIQSAGEMARRRMVTEGLDHPGTHSNS
jgi:hypothetical protein